MKARAKASLSDLQRTKGRLLLLAFFLLLLYIVLPRMDNFSASFGAVRDARAVPIAAAVCAVAVTYLFAAGVYHTLAFRLRGVRYWHTLLAQGATAFTNRLLPAGLGGLTLNVQYLRKNGHTLPQAIAIAGLNNTLGLTGHMVLLGVVLAVQHDALADQLSLPGMPGTWLAAGLAAVVVLNLIAFRRLRNYLYMVTREAAGYVAGYRHRVRKLIVAQLCAIGTTSCYVLIFYLCLYGVGIELPVWNIFVVFTVGILAGTATPTPGGLVGAEAGLVAGLVAYGVEAPLALAGVLLYRFLTYWLPLLPGFVLFMIIRKRYL